MKYINEAGWDRILRTIVGIVLLGVGFSGLVVGAAGVILKILGVLMLVTGLAGYCPVYSLFKVRTNKMSNE